MYHYIRRLEQLYHDHRIIQLIKHWETEKLSKFSQITDNRIQIHHNIFTTKNHILPFLPPNFFPEALLLLLFFFIYLTGRARRERERERREHSHPVLYFSKVHNGQRTEAMNQDLTSGLPQTSSTNLDPWAQHCLWGVPWAGSQNWARAAYQTQVLQGGTGGMAPTTQKHFSVTRNVLKNNSI